jgi:hypothetical protein
MCPLLADQVGAFSRVTGLARSLAACRIFDELSRIGTITWWKKRCQSILGV